MKHPYKANEQYIITYEDVSDSRIRKHTTAYDEDQAKYYLLKCLERHGRGSNARICRAHEIN